MHANTHANAHANTHANAHANTHACEGKLVNMCGSVSPVTAVHACVSENQFAVK